MGTQPKESPSIAFGLSLVGGIIIVLAGLLVSLVGALLTFFVAGVGGVFGLVGVFWGILIIVCAALLRWWPDQHVPLGVGIIFFSLFSWLGSFGGFLIGFLLAFVGGILAVVWRPSSASANLSMSPVPVPVSESSAAGASPTIFCPNCGSPVDQGARFCKNCGKML